MTGKCWSISLHPLGVALQLDHNLAMPLHVYGDSMLYALYVLYNNTKHSESKVDVHV